MAGLDMNNFPRLQSAFRVVLKNLNCAFRWWPTTQRDDLLGGYCVIRPRVHSSFNVHEKMRLVPVLVLNLSFGIHFPTP